MGCYLWSQQIKKGRGKERLSNEPLRGLAFSIYPNKIALTNPNKAYIKMEADAEIHSQTLSQAQGVLLKTGRRDGISQGDQGHDG